MLPVHEICGSHMAYNTDTRGALRVLSLGHPTQRDRPRAARRGHRDDSSTHGCPRENEAGTAKPSKRPPRRLRPQPSTGSRECCPGSDELQAHARAAGYIRRAVGQRVSAAAPRWVRRLEEGRVEGRSRAPLTKTRQENLRVPDNTQRVPDAPPGWLWPVPNTLTTSVNRLQDPADVIARPAVTSAAARE